MTKMLRLLVSAVLLAWVAWRTDWIQVGAIFGHLRLELWLGAVGIFFGQQPVVIGKAIEMMMAQPFRQTRVHQRALMIRQRDAGVRMNERT